MALARFGPPVFSAVVALVALGGILATDIRAQTEQNRGAVVLQQDEATRVRELAERFLATSAGYGPPGAAQAARLYVGSLPSQSGLDLPLPPGGQIAGAVARDYGDHPYSLQVLVDAPGSPTAVQRFYEDTLLAAGWRQGGFGPSSRPGGGFQTAPLRLSNTLCHDERDLVLTIESESRATGSLARIMALYPGEVAFASGPGGIAVPSAPSARPPLCAGAPAAPVQPPPSADVPRDPLPALALPLGSQTASTTRTAGAGNLGAEVLLDTDESVAQLEAHFARQLEGDGWVRQAGGVSGPLAWSQWLVPGPEEQRAWVFALDTSTPGRRAVVLRMERALDEGETPAQFRSRP